MLMKIREYRDTQFTEGSRPKLETIRKWINDGALPGEIIGKQYFVKINEIKPVNKQAAKIFNMGT